MMKNVAADAKEKLGNVTAKVEEKVDKAKAFASEKEEKAMAHDEAGKLEATQHKHERDAEAEKIKDAKEAENAREVGQVKEDIKEEKSNELHDNSIAVNAPELGSSTPMTNEGLAQQGTGAALVAPGPGISYAF